MINLNRSIIPAVVACLMGAMPASAETYTTVTTTTYGPHVVYGGIGINRAQEIALGEQPGHIEASEMVRATDGRPIYMVTISNASGIYSVSIDGVSGRVVDDVQQGVRYHQPNFWDRLFAPTHVD